MEALQGCVPLPRPSLSLLSCVKTLCTAISRARSAPLQREPHPGRLGGFGGANLTYADVTGAYLFDAELSDAHLARADLSGVSWPEEQIPEGWMADADSARLKRAGQKSNSRSVTCLTDNPMV